MSQIVIEDFRPEVDAFLNRSTIICGASNSGKSTVIRDILHLLRGTADQIIVFAPTDSQNGTYECMIPKPFIHYTISADILKELCERQMALSAVVKRANNLSTLREALKFARNTGEAEKKLASIDALQKKRLSELNAESKLIEGKTIKADADNARKAIYKRAIIKSRNSIINNDSASEDVKFAAKYLSFNPNMVVIFDDCTVLLDKLKNNSDLGNMFFQGRWMNITLLLACHTDKTLSPQLKRNAFSIVFTSHAETIAYCGRESTGMQREDRRKLNEICNIVFDNPVKKHQKLIWLREKNKFQRYQPMVHEDFSFVSDSIAQFAEKIGADTSVNCSNSYSGLFV